MLASSACFTHRKGRRCRREQSACDNSSETVNSMRGLTCVRLAERECHESVLGKFTRSTQSETSTAPHASHAGVLTQVASGLRQPVIEVRHNSTQPRQLTKSLPQDFRLLPPHQIEIPDLGNAQQAQVLAARKEADRQADSGRKSLAT